MFETSISDGARNGMIVGFRDCPPPVRGHEEIGAVVTEARRAESIIGLMPGRSGNAGVRTTGGVHVFDRYVAARRDTKYGWGTGEQQHNDGNDSRNIAPKLPRLHPCSTLHVDFLSGNDKECRFPLQAGNLKSRAGTLHTDILSGRSFPCEGRYL